VCLGFRLRKREDYFWVDFDHFFNRAVFLEAAGAVLKIGLSLNQTTIGKFSLPKSVKRSADFTMYLPLYLAY